MPVVLLTNLHRQSGLVNGSQGQIIGFEKYDSGKLPRARRRGGEQHTLQQWIFFGDTAKYQEHEVRKFNKRVSANQRLWPIVKSKHWREPCTNYPFCEVHEIGADPPYGLMSRTQIPQLAAWAITTHKSQGMTLNQAEIDMSDAWEPGQMYTAMSRVRTLEGLRVSGLSYGTASRADPVVKEFMDGTAWVKGAG